MAEYTTAQIAVMTAHSERQVQRWIKERKLKAEHRAGNVYEVDESDLEPFLPRAMTDNLVARLEALEQRMSELERLVQEKPVTSPRPSVLRPPHVPYVTRSAGQGDTLPGDLVSYPSFARLHGIGVSTTQKAIETGRLVAVHGEWKQGKAVVKIALDAAGRAQFYELYHENPHFTSCQDCPH